MRFSPVSGGSRFVVTPLPKPPLSELFLTLCACFLRSGPWGGSTVREERSREECYKVCTMVREKCVKQVPVCV
ncbi:MAG: hypothetical protein EBZ59_12050, partial [Planctomycetia bacterium]|nr:hypothetical protein [Planctomycetia bacterium]